MASRYRWRQQLLGSLQGQLQLATYLVVFLGFTGASSVGLWIGQRNLIEKEITVLSNSADYCQKAIDAQAEDALLSDVLEDHSSHRTTLWLEQPDGALIIPDSDFIPRSLDAMRASMRANPGKVVGQQLLIASGDTQYLSELVEQYPSGARLWINHEVGSNQEALNDYLGLMILIWGSCLTVTLLSVSWFVERIIRPLEQLNAATDQVTADTLDSARLHLEDGPSEVIQLSRTYNALLERLAQSWGQQRQFVSAVSHELRTSAHHRAGLSAPHDQEGQQSQPRPGERPADRRRGKHPHAPADGRLVGPVAQRFRQVGHRQ
ncbi:MAG: hypothetical protein CM15mP39_10750 [Synechococcus sp.]|nr:MAG: hypothetical protein CM15mP39_10750 [Synechococcus sp.]